MKKIALLFFFVLFIAAAGLSYDAVEAQPVSDKFIIDGKLDEVFYRTTTPYKLMGFPNKDKITRQTEVWLCRDKQNLIIAFKCYESDIGKIKKEETLHDGEIFKDDCVEIFIVPDNRRPSGYYHMAVTAAGTRFDCDNSPDAVDGFSWNPKWKSSVYIGDNYWIAEISIPLSCFLWGKVPAINLCRTRNSSDCEFSTLAELKGGSFHSTKDFLPLQLAGLPALFVVPQSSLTFYPKLQNPAKFLVRNQDRSPHSLRFSMTLTGGAGAIPEVIEQEYSLKPESETDLLFNYKINKKYQNYEFRIILDDSLFFTDNDNIPHVFTLSSPGNIFFPGEKISLMLDCSASYSSQCFYRVSLCLDHKEILLADKILFATKTFGVIRMPDVSVKNAFLKIQLFDSENNLLDELNNPINIIDLGK